RVYDYIILGAGPAGLQLAYHMRSAGWDYLILEAGDGPGHFFRTFPRHRKLISINKRHTGYEDPELRLRMDWNSLLSDDPRLLFPNYSASFFPRAEDLVRYLESYATTFALNARYATRIDRVARADLFELGTSGGETYRCRRLVLATGVSRPYLPEIPGIDLAATYVNASFAPRDYLDQRVLVIGKGNSAFETADNLVETAAVLHVAGPRAIQFAWRTHFVGHLRAVNNNILDTYQLKSQNAILDANVLRIERRGDKPALVPRLSRPNGGPKEPVYHPITPSTGLRFCVSLFLRTS